jgi:cell division protein FtsI (penicillin-binding protein 3)
METKTGEIKAISNLGKNKKGEYVETENYAVREAQEPGSTFKTVGMMALLDQNLADTSTVFNTYGGKITMKNKIIKDSGENTENLMSLARGLELSANTVIVQAIYNNYKYNPEKFTNFIESLKLDEPLGLQLKGEGKPFVPKPKTKNWTPTTLPWMAFGYNLSLTPLQTLTFYNAIANNGIMIKPLFVKEIKEWDKVMMKYDTEIINPQICNPQTIEKLKVVLSNVVKKGTAKALYSKNFSMAGKTGTVQVDYFRKNAKMYYASSFAGFFPVDNPMYSCIVIVNKPNADFGIYGADVAGPVFKRIAQKIYTDSPLSNQIILNNKINKKTRSSYQSFTNNLNNKTNIMPNLKGWSAMDAIALLESMKLKVKISGNGKVIKQSIEAGTRVNKKTLIFLELS